MPELPEVETWRRLVLRNLIGKRIEQCRVANDRIIFDDASPAAVRKALRGARIEDADRRGKYLWLLLDRRPWPLFHFGMTGSFILQSSADAAPDHTPLHMRMDNGATLYYRNLRRLGRVRLRQDPLREDPVARLGFDPAHHLPPAAELHALIRRRDTPIKALLLDQSFAAGIGNWIADEVLYQSRIAPHRRAHSLSPGEVKRLRRCLRRIVDKAIEAGADARRFPHTWLFHHRWGKKPNRRTSGGGSVRYDTVGGRTTAWVPEVQR